MSHEHKQFGYGFWLGWVLANAVGWAGGWAIMTAWDLDSSGSIAPSMLGMWTVIGLAQWLVLRRRVHKAGWWVLASFTGGLVAPVVGVGLAVLAVILLSFLGVDVLQIETTMSNEELERILNVIWLIMAFGVGAVTGMPQRLVLRRQVQRASWWVLASAVGWVVAGGAVLVFGGPYFGAAADVAFSSGAAAGVAFGVVTGIPLVWLLRQPVSGGGG